MCTFLSTLQLVRAAVRHSGWTFSIDIKDAHLHVPIHPGSYRYLRLAPTPTEELHFRALPFGLNTAPLIFKRIVEAIASFMKFCLHVHVYLIDWQFRHPDRKILLQLVAEIVAFLQSLGREVNLEKSSLTNSQSFEYIGLRFRSDLEIVHPADHLLDRLH